ncbi:MAG: EF-Tu/IF-2/RF-3 family GTPase [Promethearchaeota archaeon]
MSEVKERNFIIGIFGENYKQRKLLGQALGSPGTKSDIQFFNRLDGQLGHVFCSMTPIDYPDKIKPFLQVLAISDIHVLNIDLEIGLNAVIGESIVGIELMHELRKTKVLIVISGINSKTEWKLSELKKKLKVIIDTTNIKDSEIFEIKEKEDYNIFKKKIVKLGLGLPNSKGEEDPYLKILVDHVFPVKGIGTVILGVVKRGIIKTGQMVEIVGYEGPSKKVIIRNIQKHDRDFKEAFIGDRVGLALKGNISPSDLSRDNIITLPNIFQHEKRIRAKVYINLFYKPKKGKIKPGESTQYHGIVEIKSSPMKITEGEELIPGNSGIVSLEFDKTLVHDGSGLKGIITEMNRFENKLRIIGWFSQIIKK